LKKENQTETNYIAQLIINQILMMKLEEKKITKNAIVMNKNKKEIRKKKLSLSS